MSLMGASQLLFIMKFDEISKEDGDLTPALPQKTAGSKSAHFLLKAAPTGKWVTDCGF